MANTKSAQKQARVSRRREIYNKGPHHLCKTTITKAEKLIAAGDQESAKKAVAAAISALDKAAEKGVIHPNNAARRKSRLMKKLNGALTPPAPAAEGKEAG